MSPGSRRGASPRGRRKGGLADTTHSVNGRDGNATVVEPEGRFYIRERAVAPHKM
jgi:hypothetical protein